MPRIKTLERSGQVNSAHYNWKELGKFGFYYSQPFLRPLGIGDNESEGLWVAGLPVRHSPIKPSLYSGTLFQWEDATWSIYSIPCVGSPSPLGRVP